MDLYREYGKAALAAAGLENKLILLIALHRTTSQNDEIFTKEYEKLHRKTLGGLIKEARASAIFTESSNENLKLILEFRNWMVHHIARDMLGYVVQENGMKNLEHNLREIAVFFNEASEMCGQEIQRIIKDRGINLYPFNLKMQVSISENYL
ncbi:hypothetical protein [Vibrio cholerae]|uniref:hypothetical protein n=1 Tax=Vibrio cholerae TaxID=666 RepID=UPI0011587FAA|nr:hypothetical protein [Vibrio cholerae]TQQ54211.1 hypothetical protein FLL62_09025 [Vibrio cholerae]